MSVRKMKCPACGKPAVKADGADDRGRLGFTPGDKDPCPHCGAKLFVRVTEDYADDCLVTVHVGRDPEAIAKAWNEAHPIGTRVRYWPVRPTSSVLPIETRTTSVGYVNSGGDHASIMVEGVSGSVNLSTHVDALPAVLEPAPVVAAEGQKPIAYRYDVDGYPPSWATFRLGGVPGQTETPLYDKAALVAAREEGRREGWLEAVTMLREGLTAERDDARADMDKRDTESHEAGYVAGVTWAIAQINESVREAAKGAAK